MSEVIVYRRGLLCCSVCAPVEMAAADVAAEAERTCPAGTEMGWQVSTDTAFHTGEAIPCPCNKLPGRQHWLLDC